MGSGGAMDIGMRFTADNGAYIGIAASDLAGRIRWSQVPRLRLEVTDAQVKLCGGSSVPPAGWAPDWTSTDEPVVLHLSPRYLVEGAYPLNKVVLRGRLEAMSGELFPLMGIDYALTPGWKIRVWTTKRRVRIDRHLGTQPLLLPRPDWRSVQSGGCKDARNLWWRSRRVLKSAVAIRHYGMISAKLTMAG